MSPLGFKSMKKASDQVLRINKKVQHKYTGTKSDQQKHVAIIPRNCAVCPPYQR